MPKPGFTEDDPVRPIEHDGEEILLIDFRHCKVDELARRVDIAAEAIRDSPEGSILTLTLLHGLTYNKETAYLLRNYAKKNGPYVLAGAVVGLGYLSAVVSPLNRMAGRRLRTFDDEASAKDFLVKEKTRLANEAAPPRTHGEPVRWEEHDGERLLIMEWGNCDAPELRKRIQKAASVIHAEPPRSIVALNFLDNFPFGRETHGAIIDFVRSNRPYIIAAAAVGLGYMKPAIPVLNRFTGRNIRAFDDPETAKQWLASERRRILGA